MNIISQIKNDFQKMQKLVFRLTKNLYKRAVRAGAKLCVADLRMKVPVVSGALKKSIASKVDTIRGDTSAYAVIGPRSSYTKTVNGVVKKPSRYFHFIERGNFAKPVLYPTFQSGEKKYMDAIQAVLAQGIKEGMK